MKTIERADGDRLDRLLNCWPFCLDAKSVKSVGIAWLFKEGGRWVFSPRITGDVALFYNAVIFVRYTITPLTGWVWFLVTMMNVALILTGHWHPPLWLPYVFGVFVHIRWAEDWRRSFLQTGVGWKLNGRFAPLFRLQSDASAAAGVTGPNYGQATGFEFGPH